MWLLPVVRIGEASNPGPVPDAIHDIDVSQCLQVGSLNAGAMLNKEDLLASLGSGVWTAGETHHTRNAVPIIRGRLRKAGFNSHFSEPVEPYRGGVSQTKGLCSGTACYSDLSLRSSPALLPADVRNSTRFLQSFVSIASHCALQVIVLYGPPVSAAHVQPLRVTNMLMEAAFQLAAGYHGPSIITGDLNATWTNCQLGNCFRLGDGLIRQCGLQNAIFTPSCQHAVMPHATCSVPVLPKGRDSDFEASITQGNFHLRRLLRQVRRLQSLCRLLVRIQNQCLLPSHPCSLSAGKVWGACKKAGCFPGSFNQWLCFEHGICAPLHVPDLKLCQSIYDLVAAFYHHEEQRYILTCVKERREEILLDWKQGGSKSFRKLRNQDEPALRISCMKMS